MSKQTSKSTQGKEHEDERRFDPELLAEHRFPRTDSYDVALLYLAWEMTMRSLSPDKNGLYNAEDLREQIRMNMHTLYDAWDNRNKKLDASIG